MEDNKQILLIENNDNKNTQDGSIILQFSQVSPTLHTTNDRLVQQNTQNIYELQRLQHDVLMLLHSTFDM